MLVVVTSPLEDPAKAGAISEIAAAGIKATRRDPDRGPDVLVLAPATNTAVAHWLSDLRQARVDAQRRVALTPAPPPPGENQGPGGGGGPGTGPALQGNPPDIPPPG